MARVLLAPVAVLVKRKLALYFAYVFTRPVVIAHACGALKSNEVWLRHIFNWFGADGENRTHGLLLTMELLCL